jgi:hypothetical protein
MPSAKNYRETLLSSSAVLLYGRVMTDLVIGKPEGERAARKGGNRLLENVIRDPEARLARIYGFAYQGRYYDLPVPAIFVVHGDGEDPEDPRPVEQGGNAYVAGGPAHVEKGGVAFHGANFAPDIKVWSYDQSDFSLRLDLSSGMLSDILLAPELDRDDPDPLFGGGKVGGGKVGGGKVGGGKVG